MNAEQRVLIIDSDLKNCKAIKYVLTEYGIGAYYTLSVIDGIERALNAVYHRQGIISADAIFSQDVLDGFAVFQVAINNQNSLLRVHSADLLSDCWPRHFWTKCPEVMNSVFIKYFCETRYALSQ